MAWPSGRLVVSRCEVGQRWGLSPRPAGPAGWGPGQWSVSAGHLGADAHSRLGMQDLRPQRQRLGKEGVPPTRPRVTSVSEAAVCFIWQENIFSPSAGDGPHTTLVQACQFPTPDPPCADRVTAAQRLTLPWPRW